MKDNNNNTISLDELDAIITDWCVMQLICRLTQIIWRINKMKDNNTYSTRYQAYRARPDKNHIVVKVDGGYKILTPDEYRIRRLQK
jgi:hypothetical protein